MAITCRNCGTENDQSNTFCDSCGTDLTKKSPRPPPIRVLAGQTQPASVTHIYRKPFREQLLSVFGILGLVIGLLGLAIFSWLIFYVGMWTIYLFLGLCILGVLLSIISTKNNAAVGITGSILCTLGALCQVGWLIFAAFFPALF